MDNGRNNRTSAGEQLERERYRRLGIWREAVGFAGAIYRKTKTFPASERWGLSSQLQRAAVSVASNIAEGSQRTAADFRKFLQYSLGSLAECDTQLTIAEQAGYGEYDESLRGKIAMLMIGIRNFARSVEERAEGERA